MFFAFLKKPVAVIIFNILSFGVFNLQNWDYTDRGVIPSSSYDWGAGYYIFYVAAFVTLAGAIWLLVNKILAKKAKHRIIIDSYWGWCKCTIPFVITICLAVFLFYSEKYAIIR